MIFLSFCLAQGRKISRVNIGKREIGKREIEKRKNRIDFLFDSREIKMKL